MMRLPISTQITVTELIRFGYSKANGREMLYLIFL